MQLTYTKMRSAIDRVKRPLILFLRVGREFRPACLESFRVHRIAERAACRNFRNLQSFRELMSSVKATNSAPAWLSSTRASFYGFQRRSPHARQQARLDANAHEKSPNRHHDRLPVPRRRIRRPRDLDEVEFEYLYNEGDEFHFMNTQTYEQMQMTREELGETVYYLIPNTTVKIEFSRKSRSASTCRTPWN